MPRLAAIQLAAFIAENSVREAMRCVVPATGLLPELQFDLNCVKNLGFDDGRVGVLVLW
jgi:hypothetical protein